jgi:hypothetical protein
VAKYLAHPCPRCKGYLGIVLRAPGRNTPLQAINGRCLQCGHRLAWILIRGKRGHAYQNPRRIYVRPAKTLERQELLRRHRELQAEIAQHERNLREGEARLPIEEQLCLKLRRFIEANIPELAGRIQVRCL